MLLTVIISFFLGTASAQTITGNELHEACSTGGVATEMFCTGYTIGAWEGMVFSLVMVLMQDDAMTAAEASEVAFISLEACPPDGVSNLQVRDVVAQSLQNHPERRHFTARILILLAMRDAFPCPIE